MAGKKKKKKKNFKIIKMPRGAEGRLIVTRHLKTCRMSYLFNLFFKQMTKIRNSEDKGGANFDENNKFAYLSKLN